MGWTRARAGTESWAGVACCSLPLNSCLNLALAWELAAWQRRWFEGELFLLSSFLSSLTCDLSAPLLL